MNHRDAVRDKAFEIKLYISKSEFEDAIKSLLDFVNNFSDKRELINEVLRLSQHYHTSRHSVRRGIINLEKHNDDLGILAEAMLNCIDSITDNYSPSEERGSTNHDLVFRGRNITRSYKKFKLNDISFELEPGSITGVVGANASGKTTLARIVAGELKKNTGEISYPLLKQNNDRRIQWGRVKLKIGFLPQFIPGWHGDLNVKSSLHFEAAIHGIKGEANKTLVNFIIHRLGLWEYQDSLWNELSSGFKVRFSIASLLVRKPMLLILDEPLANLDLNMQIEFLHDIHTLANSEKNPFAVLITSQHISEVEFIADNMIFLENGNPVFNGKTSSVYDMNKKNVFEFAVLNDTKIYTLLSRIVGSEVQFNGLYYILHTPRDYRANDIISFLVKEGVPVSYFRDLSYSTKSFLVQNIHK